MPLFDKRATVGYPFFLIPKNSTQKQEAYCFVKGVCVEVVIDFWNPSNDISYINPKSLVENWETCIRTAAVTAFAQVDVAKEELKLAQVEAYEHLWLSAYFRPQEWKQSVLKSGNTVDH